jgi:hypothetical protein
MNLVPFRLDRSVDMCSTVVVTRRGYLDEVNPLTPATHANRLQVLQSA